MTFLRRLCLILFLFLSWTSARAQGNFYLQSGDRVVFYGDSITEQSLYTFFTETYVVTRFPGMKVSFTESGWGGDRVTGGGGGPIDTRLLRDVIAYTPTVMTIMLGMNDGGYRAFDPALFETYSTGYRHIIDTVRKANPSLRVTAIQPSPFDDVTRDPTFEGGYNATLTRYAEFLKILAGEKMLDLADMNTPVLASLARAKSTDAANAQKIIPDRVHPGPGGHLLMAAALLKAWNAPSTVTAVEIDASGGRVERAENTEVASLQTGDTLSWTQMDRALPMPLNMNDPVIALAIHSSDFVETLNQQPLKVTGLTAAKYQLQIDEVSVGTFTKAQLAEGINLAVLSTPMVAQAGEVQVITRQHNDLHRRRWRQIQFPLYGDADPSVQKSLKSLLSALDKQEAGVVDKLRKTAMPREHRYRLSPEE